MPTATPSPAAAARLARLERLLPALMFTTATDAERDLFILRGLHRALRAERRRGVSGHWAYDLDRHVALVQALRSELARARAGRDGIPGAGAGTVHGAFRRRLIAVRS